MAEIITVEDVAHRSSHADLERETVMVRLMEVVMMAIEDVRGIWSVEATIVKNLVFTTMRKTTVVMSLLLSQIDPHQSLIQVFLLSLHQVKRKEKIVW